MGDLTEAIQTLQMAMSLPGVRRSESSSKSKNRKMELSPADCVSVFLELADALWLNGDQVGLGYVFVQIRPGSSVFCFFFLSYLHAHPFYFYSMKQQR